MKQPPKHLTSLACLTILALTLAVAALARPVRAALGDPPPVSGLASLTHPDASRWYANPSPVFVWRGMLATPAIAGYSFALDHSATRVPDTTIDRAPVAFAPPLVDPTVKPPTSGIVAGDFNGDGKLDLAVNRPVSASVYIQFGKGNGRFGPPHAVRVPRRINGLVVTDVNGDHKADLVMTTITPSFVPTLVVMLGKGNGTFGAPWLYPVVGPMDSLAGIVVTDLNGDHRPDIVFGDEPSGPDRVVILLNRGGGRFSVKHNYQVADDYVTTLNACDVNGDGKLDLVVGSREMGNTPFGNLSVLLGRGDGSFKPAVTVETGLLVPFSVTFSDFNGDGHGELVVGSITDRADYDGGPDYSTIATWSVANGALVKLREITFQPPLGGSFAVADYNGDGRLDLGMIGGELIVLLNNGDGTFQAPLQFAIGSGIVADFNRDGRPDIAIPPAGQGTVVTVYRNRSETAVYYHLADGVWYFHVRAIDANGAGGPTATRAVRIDTHRPVTQAPAPASVKSGGIALLSYVVTDPLPSAGWCTVQIQIRDVHNRLLLSRTFGHAHSGIAYQAAFRCRLAKGVYRFYVFARDAAGNPQHNVAFNELIVH